MAFKMESCLGGQTYLDPEPQSLAWESGAECWTFEGEGPSARFLCAAFKVEELDGRRFRVAWAVPTN